LRYLELRGEILHGLTTSFASAGRPLVEAFVGGRWAATDTFIFDAAYQAAARERLRAEGREWGYAMNVAGHSIWDGAGDAFVNAFAPQDDPMVLQRFGVFNDPAEFIESPEWRDNHPRLARALHWNVLAPAMDRVIRELRESLAPPPPAAARKPS
jgi:hypothetical protein